MPRTTGRLGGACKLARERSICRAVGSTSSTSSSTSRGIGQRFASGGARGFLTELVHGGFLYYRVGFCGLPRIVLRSGDRRRMRRRRLGRRQIRDLRPRSHRRRLPASSGTCGWTNSRLLLLLLLRRRRRCCTCIMRRAALGRYSRMRIHGGRRHRAVQAGVPPRALDLSAGCVLPYLAVFRNSLEIIRVKCLVNEVLPRVQACPFLLGPLRRTVWSR